MTGSSLSRPSPSKAARREGDLGRQGAHDMGFSSFATYVAIVAEAHLGRVSDWLAYRRLIVCEASKFGGNGWLTYDAVFRRNHEGKSAPHRPLSASGVCS